MKHEQLIDTITTAVAAATEVQQAALREELARGRGTVTLQGAENHPVAPAPAGSTLDANYGNTAGRLRGYSLRETTGAAVAAVELRDGGTSGDLLAVVNLPAGGTVTVWLGDGVAYTNGLDLIRVTGSVDGALWLGGVN